MRADTCGHGMIEKRKHLFPHLKELLLHKLQSISLLLRGHSFIVESSFLI